MKKIRSTHIVTKFSLCSQTGNVNWHDLRPLSKTVPDVFSWKKIFLLACVYQKHMPRKAGRNKANASLSPEPNRGGETPAKAGLPALGRNFPRSLPLVLMSRKRVQTHAHLGKGNLK